MPIKHEKTVVTPKVSMVSRVSTDAYKPSKQALDYSYVVIYREVF